MDDAITLDMFSPSKGDRSLSGYRFHSAAVNPYSRNNNLESSSPTPLLMNRPSVQDSAALPSSNQEDVKAKPPVSHYVDFGYKSDQSSPHRASKSQELSKPPNYQARSTFSHELTSVTRGAAKERDELSFYDSEGVQTPVKRYREMRSGIGIGLMEDGRVLIAQPSLSRQHTSFSGQLSVCGSQITEDDKSETWQLERQSTGVVQIVPRIRGDGGHLEQLEQLFNKSIYEDVDAEEIQHALTKSAEINGVQLDPQVLVELMSVIMEECDYDHDGLIQLQDLATLMYGVHSRYGTPKSSTGTGTFSGSLYEYSMFQSNSQTASNVIDHSPTRPVRQKSQKDCIESMQPNPSKADWVKGLIFSRKFRQEALFFLSNNWRVAFAIVGWLLLNVALAISKFFYYETQAPFKVLGVYLCIAKAGAEIVKLNLALLLFSVCRWTNTFLRGTFLRHVIPFDENIRFHKLAASMIAFGSVIHTVAHVWGTYLRFSLASPDQFNRYVGAQFNYKQPSYGDLLASFNSVTGYLLWIALIFLYLVSPNPNRQFFSNHTITKWLSTFQTFWWSHLCIFPLFFFLAFFHGTHKSWSKFPTHDTWMYIIGPVALYTAEKISKIIITRIYRRPLDVFQVEILPGDVLCLHLTNPPFTFKSGMYVFIQCPAISNFEWHPFSITSAPSDFELTVHIRAVGDWTKTMLEFWKKELLKAKLEGRVDGNGAIIVQSSTERLSLKHHYPRILVDGPHGSPSQDYLRFRVIMLVGAGIGVTPIASIVRDVLHKAKYRQRYPQFNLEKVHFFWTTREQGNFEWFRSVMTQAAEEDVDGIVDMHNYLTSAYGDDDPRSFLLKAAQDRFHARTGHDIITNSKTKIATHFSRPDWGPIFSKIQRRTPNTTIGVFFCGPRALQVELQKTCKQYSTGSTNGTTFVFRREDF